MLREAERGRKREETWELGRVEIKEHYTSFFPVEMQRRGARGLSVSRWKKRENLLFHPSIDPSIQTLKLRCFSSCEATGRKSDKTLKFRLILEKNGKRKQQRCEGESSCWKEQKKKKKREDAGCQVWEMREYTLRKVTGVREAGVQGRKEKERGQHCG